ncbi:hypothetical protein BDW22DRAFT_1350989 [Trametopsis cervina]|nr:hypothetical protein BDW22DRAFT_1350989 [Trametopsis cervina]
MNVESKQLGQSECGQGRDAEVGTGPVHGLRPGWKHSAAAPPSYPHHIRHRTFDSYDVAKSISRTFHNRLPLDMYCSALNGIDRDFLPRVPLTAPFVIQGSHEVAVLSRSLRNIPSSQSEALFPYCDSGRTRPADSQRFSAGRSLAPPPDISYTNWPRLGGGVTRHCSRERLPSRSRT